MNRKKKNTILKVIVVYNLYEDSDGEFLIKKLKKCPVHVSEIYTNEINKPVIK